MSMLDGILSHPWSRTNWNNDAESVETTFNADGSITETADIYEKRTAFREDGSLLETYLIRGFTKLIVLIEFAADGSITETVQ